MGGWRISDLTIKRKIPVLTVGVTLVACAAIAACSGLMQFFETKNSVKTHLEYIVATKSLAVAAAMDAAKRDMQSLAGNPALIKAFDDLDMGFSLLPEAEKKTLSSLKASGGNLNSAMTSSSLAFIDNFSKNDEWLQSFAKEYGCSGVFLVNTKGELIYSTGLDPLGKLDVGSDLGGVWASSRDDMGTVIRDFAPPTKGQPGQAFFAAPVINGKGRTGTLLVTMSAGVVDAIMHDSTGFGSAGEALLAARDGTPRTTSRLKDDMLAPVDARFLDTGSYEGEYGDEEVLVSSKKLDWSGLSWSVVAIEPLSEVFAPVRKMIGNIAAITALIGLLSLVLAIFASRSISRPIMGLVGEMKLLASGHTEVEISGTDRGDEVGEIARTVLIFQKTTVARLALEHQAETTRSERDQRQNAVEASIHEFRQTVENLLGRMNANGIRLRHSADELEGIATSAAFRAESAKYASDNASISVQAVANASSELSASINEIATQISRTRSVVEKARGQAEATHGVVGELSGAARAIGDVVKLISDIAGQTNLLALNATIEAARAGDAGSGFAVVANEVKSLANQTAGATDDIGRQIAAIQASTMEAVRAITGIAETMLEVDGNTNSIASAIEEQGAATQNISANVQLAASGTQSANEDVGSLSQAVAQTADTARGVLQASDEMRQTAEVLNGTIEEFLKRVTA